MGRLDSLYKTARDALRTARRTINDFVEEVQKTSRNDYGDLANMIDGILGAEQELDKFQAAVHEEAQEAEEESRGPRLVPGSVAGATEGISVAKGETLKQLLESQELSFDKHIDSMFRGE